MNKLYFLECIQKVEQQNKNKNKNGIGTLGEKTLHSTIKYYLEPNDEFHEVKIDRFVADIFDGENIKEIQTGSFSPLRNKIHKYIKTYKTEIIYPVPKTKWVCWVDNKTGEITKKRKSPKSYTPCEILPQLYRIKDELNSANLCFKVIMINMIEYRLLDGWSKDSKRGSHRIEYIPVSLENEIILSKKSDYIEMISSINKDNFTSKDFAKYSHLSLSKARTALLVLTYINAVVRIGKKGNTIIYKLNNKKEKANS